MKSLFNYLKNYFNLQSNFGVFLLICSFIVFGFAFLSIPACSFIVALNPITWALTILLCFLIILILVFYGTIKIDFINISLVLFGIFALFSSLINGMRAFVFTPILLAVFSALIYTFCINNRKVIKPLFISAYVGDILFLILFIFQYRSDLIHLNFARLGSAFGDINDIAIFMGFGAMTAFMFTFYSKKLLFKILNAFILCIFGFCGLSCGSKIFILIVAITFIVGIFFIFGKKRWWLSIIVTCFLVGLFFAAINLPFLVGLKNRFMNMFATLKGEQKVDAGINGRDLSTIDRVNMFVDGITMWLRKPVLGYGIQGFFRASSYGKGWSHNHISETLASFGLVGAITFHFGFIRGMCGYFKNKKDSYRTIFFMIFIFFIICMISVALNSEKIYAYLIPLPIAFLTNERQLYELKLSSIFKRKDHKND